MSKIKNAHSKGQKVHARGRPPNLRDLRAMAITAIGGIIWWGHNVLTIPSTKKPDVQYKADINGPQPTCNCPHWQSRKRGLCKHLRAALRLLKHFGPETMSEWPVPFEIPPLGTIPKGFRNNRPYSTARRRPHQEIEFSEGPTEATRRNNAYAKMPLRIPELINQLCMMLALARALSKGGQPMLLHDRLFCLLYRYFRNGSYDFVLADLVKYAVEGLIEWVPSRNSLSAYLHDPTITECLRTFLRLTARCVRKIEHLVIIDATAFSTIRCANWVDSDHGKKDVRPETYWLKVHAASGATTNIVVAVETTLNLGESTNDTTRFEALARRAASTWDVTHFLADKGYLSERNLVIAGELGAQAIIPIKKNWKLETKKAKEAAALYELYTQRNEQFEELYRYRSKIECVFSAIKRTTGHFARSRGLNQDTLTTATVDRIGVARENEMLAKFIIHNLRSIVVLEEFHNMQMNFAADRTFEPLNNPRAPEE